MGIVFWEHGGDGNGGKVVANFERGRGAVREVGRRGGKEGLARK